MAREFTRADFDDGEEGDVEYAAHLEEMEHERRCDDDFYNQHDGVDCDFADPGGSSALRAASATNPRNLPCPTCERPNLLTPADRARGYQCDRCADRAESGMDY